MNEPRVGHKAGWLVVAALVAVTIYVFLPLGKDPFVALDDVNYVVENPIVRGGLTAAGVSRAFSGVHEANWHPVTWISHMIDVSMFGMNPGRHHLVNVALHIVNVALLLALLIRLTGVVAPSALAAALFAVHPLHVESVAWVAERKDILSAFFLFLMLFAYSGYARHRTPRRYLGVVAMLALGLMAKPMLVTAPFLLLLLDWWPLGRFARQGGVPATVRGPALRGLVLEKVPLLALALASSVVTLAVQSRSGAVGDLTDLPFNARLENAIVSYLAYLGKTVLPTGLGVFYPHPGNGLTVWQVAAAAGALVVATVLICRAARRFPFATVGWFWYLGTLVPVIGLVQVGAQAMADRYTYVPLLGIFLATAWGAAALPLRAGASRAARAALILLAVSSLALLARRQVGYYESNERLFLRTLQVTGPNKIIRTNLGAEYVIRGEYAAAEEQYRAALAIDPQGTVENFNYGDLLVKTRRPREAIPYFRKALEKDPVYAKAHYYLGLMLGNSEEAAAHLRAALRGLPGDPVLRAALDRIERAAAR